ncbi:5536_t:CDS:2 [Paraglomus occultum]|uniref:5536_t:CDS:1 n=1 Tax=Paraglomus occultum TaxID=144539 RepID=A0A9N9BSY3_9GLOM|nr:5536_t:CDS:2 [Paraglomus occultum]
MPPKRNVKHESEGTPRRSKRLRLVRDDSVLAAGASNLRLSSGSGDSYDLDDLPSSASLFKNSHIEVLRVRVNPASAESDVIPTVEVLGNPEFDVEDIDEITNKKVRTFFANLHDVVINGMQVVGTDETFTDTLVDGLLRIVELNDWPLRVRNHPFCILDIADSRVSSDPGFVIKKRKIIVVVVVEDKHLRNVRPNNGFGESQISVEILACANENMRKEEYQYRDQTLWAIRTISHYVTFYKADIPAEYWRELDDGVPQSQSVEVQRWPRENTLLSGFDLAQPAGRRAVLKALVQIRELLLQDDD